MLHANPGRKDLIGAQAIPEPHLAAAPAAEEFHCQRVAALAGEIGRELGLQDEIPLVEAVALLHHCLPRNLSEPAGLLHESLRAAHSLLPAGGDPAAFLNGDLVRLANSFDEMIEWLEFEPEPVDELVRALEAIAPLEGWRPDVMGALRQVSRDRWQDLLTAGENLPVSSVLAIRKLAFTRLEDLSAESLSRLAAGDPVLTADILRVVHSAAHHTLRGKVHSLKTAIVYLGVETTKAVMLSSLARGVFASGEMESLWRHSLAVAAHARGLASLCGYDQDAAFLAGLLHDIGRLAMERLDAGTQAMRARMKQFGTPATWIDLVTCRHGHAEVGGHFLDTWGFAPEIVEGVAQHHSPERSEGKLASLLYLAEQLAGGENQENMPSLCRLNHALETLGLPEWPLAEIPSQEFISALIAA